MVDHWSYLLHDWCDKYCGIYYPVCGMVYIKYSLLLAKSCLKVAAIFFFVVRAFTHGAMGCRIDPTWGEPTELFLIPSSAPQLV